MDPKVLLLNWKTLELTQGRFSNVPIHTGVSTEHGVGGRTTYVAQRAAVKKKKSMKFRELLLRKFYKYFCEKF